jgi:zinc-binding alcohol dehydrogenase/oxidoreductase
MRALILEQINTPVVVGNVPDPKPETGEVLVALHYAAINHRDVWIRKGQYAGITVPIVLGSDGAGLVNGREVVIYPARRWGDQERYQSADFEILGLPQQGTFAEYICVDVEQIFDKPAHLQLHEAAALPLAGLTAYRALFSQARLKKKETVLVTGIGGGVASLALQMAVANGNKVFVTSSSENKILTAVALGAAGGVNYQDLDWQKSLRTMSGGIDVVIDGAAGAGLGKIVSICKPGARLVIYGGTAGTITDLSPQILFWKQMQIIGSTMGSTQDFARMLAFMSKHQIVPQVSAVYPLADGNAALDAVEQGKQSGKVVIQIVV